MAWDFETDPEFQEELDWVADFVREEVEPLDFVIRHGYDLTDPVRQELIPPLQEKVKARGLWACHLGPELGGPGYGQVKLALLNEILGTAHWAPIVFGCQAPDSGNAEILAHYGTPEQKERWLEPLLDNTIVSCFSMTEPQGGADPKVFTTRAELDGDEWVINGEKWFSSHARFASFLIVMAVTEPDNPPYQQMSMFIVPTDTPGRRDHPQRRPRLRAGGRRHPRLHPLHRRPRAQGEPARRSRRRVRRRPDPPRRRSHPPRHAHRRPGPEGLRHDVRAGAVAHHAGRAARPQAARAGHDRRLVDRDRVVPAARDAHGVAHRQVQGLQAGAQGHLGGQGDDARGCSTTSPRGRCSSTARSACPTRCRSRRWSSSRSTWASPTGRPRCTRSRSPARSSASTSRPTGMFPTRHIPARREAAIARYRDVIERHVVQL